MKSFFKITMWLMLVGIIAAAGVAGYFWYIWSSNLPYIGSVKEYQPPIITEVYSRDGEVIGRFWEQKRIVVDLAELPQHLVLAFVAAEDARFFEHRGVDLLSIARALYKNVTAGRIEQGGSTITQQMTRSLLLRNTERTYRRKVREALLAVQIEKNFTKEEILYRYVNEIYLGQGAYGVEAAALTYFDKSARDLSLAESALLAGLPQAPARYSPITHFDRAKGRQRYVLERMEAEGFISTEQFQEALGAPLELKTERESAFAKAPYFTEQVRQYLLERYGRDLLYRGGLQVYTTLDLEMQRAARAALRNGLAQLDKREGYRGPIRHLGPEEAAAYRARIAPSSDRENLVTGTVTEGLVTEVNDPKELVEVQVGADRAKLPLAEMTWARKPDPEVPYYAVKVERPSEVLREGDVIQVRILEEGTGNFDWEVTLAQEPQVQGALFSMVPETGEVRAMVGGRDFFESQFNRAVQSRRQPGSAFKPLIYAAALDWGMDPGEVIMDAPYIDDQYAEDDAWKPKNYKERFFGPTLLRTGLVKSRNVITVKILKEIGVNYAVDYARNLGIQSDLSPDLSLALGASGVSLVELTRAYGVFANQGVMVQEPILVTQVLDRSGRVIEENQPSTTQVISSATAYVMTDLLKAVIQEGTGWRAKALGRPAAGKTGTTNNLMDAWFMGYTPQLVAGVWVGYDDQKAMGKGETGSRAASPIWLDFMSTVLDGRPVVDFKAPEGVVFAKIDAETGFLASSHSDKTVFQAFREGTEPKEYSEEPTSPKTGRFLQFDLNRGSQTADPQ